MTNIIVEIMRKCITICTPLSALFPVHVDRRGPVSVEASGGHVITHRLLEVGDDLPEDELHVLAAGQGDTDAGELQPVGKTRDLMVNSLLVPLSLPSSARRAGN